MTVEVTLDSGRFQVEMPLLRLITFTLNTCWVLIYFYNDQKKLKSILMAMLEISDCLIENL